MNGLRLRSRYHSFVLHYGSCYICPINPTRPKHCALSFLLPFFPPFFYRLNYQPVFQNTYPLIHIFESGKSVIYITALYHYLSRDNIRLG